MRSNPGCAGPSWDIRAFTAQCAPGERLWSQVPRREAGMRRLTSTPAHKPAKLTGSRKGVLGRKVLSLGTLHCSMFLTFDFPLSLAPSCPASDRTREQCSLTATPQLYSQASRRWDRAPCSTVALQSLPRPSSVCASRTRDTKHTLRMQARQKSATITSTGRGMQQGQGTDCAKHQHPLFQKGQTLCTAPRTAAPREPGHLSTLRNSGRR